MIYEYRYALASELDGYYKDSWKLAGKAGFVCYSSQGGYELVIFIKRESKLLVRNKRKAHKTVIKKLRIYCGLAWKG
jgi:hypothetical protein